MSLRECPRSAQQVKTQGPRSSANAPVHRSPPSGVRPVLGSGSPRKSRPIFREESHNVSWQWTRQLYNVSDDASAVQGFLSSWTIGLFLGRPGPSRN